MLLLGLVVVAGAAGLIALGSRRLRTAAGAVAVLAASAALVGLIADPHSDPELSRVGGAGPCGEGRYGSAAIVVPADTAGRPHAEVVSYTNPCRVTALPPLW